MEYRLLGDTGLRVPVLSFGTMTFGGEGYFARMGTTGVAEARELVDLCLDRGANLVDTADVYSMGRSEEILGEAIRGRRDQLLLATKLHGRMGDGPNDLGQSRHHIVRACEASLRRLGTDWIDLYQVHHFDALTSLEHVLRALDDLVRSGKVRYVGCSNYSAWHLMKALDVSDRLALERYVSLQAHYSLISRELEWELVPLCLDQRVGIVVWSPLAGGFLTGKIRRGGSFPEESRFGQGYTFGGLEPERGFEIVDVLEEIAGKRGVSAGQVAINWLLSRPGVTSVIVGARSREHLVDNLDAAAWELSEGERARLDEVSDTPLPYPYWHQRRFNAERHTP